MIARTGTDVLFLPHRLPWPPDRGDRIRSWHLLRALVRLRTVHVVAPFSQPVDPAHVDQVRSVAATVALGHAPSRGMAVARALVRGTPASVEAFASPAVHAAVAERLATGTVGTIFAFSGQMAQYVPHDFGGRFVMDFVDMDSAKFAALGAKAWGLGGVALRREAKRLAAFEIATAKRADTSLFVSEAEAALFTRATSLSAQVIENGVDAARFAPDAVLPVAAPRPLVVFTGQMDYPPNVEAVTRFARDVLPLIADARFAIVGRAPTAAVRALGGARVTVTGEVTDTRPWLAAASVVVAPLLLARGVQNKVLEAMAMARPVIASSEAARGIEAQSGSDILVADTPTDIATAVAALIADPDRAAAIGRAARARVLARYAWAARLAPLRDLVV